MVEDIIAVFFVSEELMHFVDVLPNLGKVERPEILEEALIGEILTIFERYTLSILKKKALGTSFGGLLSAR